jgi:hypothetical protein
VLSCGCFANWSWGGAGGDVNFWALYYTAGCIDPRFWLRFHKLHQLQLHMLPLLVSFLRFSCSSSVVHIHLQATPLPFRSCCDPPLHSPHPAAKIPLLLMCLYRPVWGLESLVKVLTQNPGICMQLQLTKRTSTPELHFETVLGSII